MIRFSGQSYRPYTFTAKIDLCVTQNQREIFTLDFLYKSPKFYNLKLCTSEDNFIRPKYPYIDPKLTPRVQEKIYKYFFLLAFYCINIPQNTKKYFRIYKKLLNIPYDTYMYLYIYEK